MAEIKTSTMTCSACPVQIEGQLEDGRRFYFRYRYARAKLTAWKDRQGGRHAPGAVAAVVRDFPDRDEMHGYLDALEATELLASMAGDLPDDDD